MTLNGKGSVDAEPSQQRFQETEQEGDAGGSTAHQHRLQTSPPARHTENDSLYISNAKRALSVTRALATK